MSKKLADAKRDLEKYYDDEYHILNDSTISTFNQLLESAIAAENTEPNPPLSLEEIKTMAGSDYWHQNISPGSKKSFWNTLPERVANDPERFNYGIRWLAYKHEIVESEEQK